MTEANSPRPVYVLVRRSDGKCLKHLDSGLLFPVFDFPHQAFRYAGGLGINSAIYDIIDVNKTRQIKGKENERK